MVLNAVHIGMVWNDWDTHVGISAELGFEYMGCEPTTSKAVTILEQLDMIVTGVWGNSLFVQWFTSHSFSSEYLPFLDFQCAHLLIASLWYKYRIIFFGIIHS